MFKPIVVSLLCWLSFVSNPLWAMETVRVAVMEGIHHVTIRSPNPFYLKTTSPESMAQPAMIKVDMVYQTGGEITINGRKSHVHEWVFLPVQAEEGGENGFVVNGQPYPGILRVKQKEKGLLIINEVALERYLAGVVPSEMSPKWNKEALKVQAIISRTYALYQKMKNSDKDYDLWGSVLGQVYTGDAGNDPAVDQAIRETAGIVLTYQGRPALTFFHSTSAGRTEDAAELWGIDLPYLKGVNCPFDRDSPYYRWTRSLPLQNLEQALRDNRSVNDPITGILPGDRSRAGRLLTVLMMHKGGKTIVKANDLRKAIGFRTLPSTNFSIDAFGPTLQISGQGYGHGVGLCQWGAKVLAERGYKADAIMHYYYPGLVLQGGMS